MVEKFVGTWKMISSENFDDYMKAIGRGAGGGALSDRIVCNLSSLNLSKRYCRNNLEIL